MYTNVKEKPSMETFEEIESEVRSYSRNFDQVFYKAKGSKLWDVHGKEYIDFFAGAGSVNYGHNNEKMKQKLVQYLLDDGVTHSLDMATAAKEEFLLKFDEIIMKPRNMDYKIMFPGPTGTNAVESALKIARKVTGRNTIMTFTNAFHGMSLGSLSITGNQSKREGAGIPLGNSTFVPYDKYFGEDVDTVEYIERLLEDGGSGVDVPAAIILETVQGEGGLNVARTEWLQRIEALCERWDILLIVDDIQMGCGRTGTFFSFEHAGIKPDIICLSKSIGGFGLPFALTLIKPDYDVFEPGEHNGTFRGNNLAFVASAESLSYWEDDLLTKEIERKSEKIRLYLDEISKKHPELEGELKGRGFIQGIKCKKAEHAEEISKVAFDKGLIMETSGPKSEVFKVMPALTISDEELDQGLNIIAESVAEVLKEE